MKISGRLSAAASKLPPVGVAMISRRLPFAGSGGGSLYPFDARHRDFIAGLNDQIVPLIVEPLVVMVGDGGGFLLRRIGRDHLARDEILANAEMFKRTLGLGAPKFVR
jgi:hypothetical protein